MLAGSYQEHRERCEECQPEPCPVLVAYREHKAGCWNCDNGVTFETDRERRCPMSHKEQGSPPRLPRQHRFPTSQSTAVGRQVGAGS